VADAVETAIHHQVGLQGAGFDVKRA